MISKALIFATQCHENQVRRGSNLPYIVHPIAVASNVRAYCHTKNLTALMTAALLHDVVEDCKVTIQEIAQKFGEEVGHLVLELTSYPAEIEKMGKTRYLKEKMINMSDDALMIKLCDRLDNVRDYRNIEPESERAQEYFNSTREILEYLSLSRNMNSVHVLLSSDILRLC